MALSKSKTLPNGTSGNYWKIVEEHYDRVSHVCTWSIALFVSHDVSVLGADLGLTKHFSKVLTSDEATGNRTALGYTYIKSKSAEAVKNMPPSTSTHPFDSDLKDAVDA